jgi:hypothetical protein
MVAGQNPYDGEQWSPSGHVPERAAELLGLWFWGNTAHELRWIEQCWHSNLGPCSVAWANVVG